MFENIIGHSETVRHIEGLLQSDSFPQVVLLAGGACSGKLTVALEIARVLTCEQPHAPWGCRCASCEQHRRLEHPQVLQLGNRGFQEEILAAGDALTRAPGAATRYLFGRSVRKLLNRFHPVLWEGEEKRLSGAMANIEAATELVEEIFPPVDEPSAGGAAAGGRSTGGRGARAKGPDDADSAALERQVQRLQKKTAAVLEKAPKDMLHAEAIRRMNFWVHVSSQRGPKVIILEHVDGLNDSQRNLLLKTLEEPPENVYFLLTTSRRSAILPTILSRVRTVVMKPRSQSEQAAVLQRIFRVPEHEVPGEDPLERFFEARVCQQIDEVRAAADRWAQHLAGVGSSSATIPEEDLPGIHQASGSEQRAAGVRLLRLIVAALRVRFLANVSDSPADVRAVIRIRQVLAEIDRCIHEIGELNINAAQVLEGLWFRGNSPGKTG